MRLESTVLSDLSANVFAALLLILLILMQSGAASDRDDPARDRQPVEATTDLKSRARTPMRSGDLVAFFYDRRPVADGLSLDLMKDGVSGTRKGQPLAEDVSPSTLNQVLREMDPGDPIRLYVFSQQRYDGLAQALSGAGLRWQEISVPQALRSASKNGWSQGFLTLLERQFDQDRFRGELARLLAASPDPLSRDGGVAGGRAGAGAGASAVTASGESLLARLMRGLAVGLGIAAMLAGITVIVAVETLVPRSRARYPDLDSMQRVNTILLD